MLYSLNQIAVTDSQLKELTHEINGFRQDIRNLNALNKERESEHDELQKDLHATLKKMDKVFYLLVGTEEQPQTGILKRLENLEAIVAGYDKIKNRFSAYVTAAMAIGGILWFIVGSVVKLVDFFTNHK